MKDSLPPEIKGAPHLKKFSAKLKLQTGTGAKLDYDYTSSPGAAHKTLIAAIRELARIAAVAGLQDETREAVDTSIEAVAKFNAERDQASQSHPLSRS